MREVASPKSLLTITLIQLGLLLLVTFYTFIGGQTAQVIYDHQWRLITLWLTTFLIGGWLLVRFFGRHRIPRTPFDLPLLFLFIAWILATLASLNPVYSRETLVFFIIYLFFFYLAADVGRWPWIIELVFNAIIAVSGLVWTLAAWQLMRWYQNLPPVPELLQGSEPALNWIRLSVLGNPNTMASYLGLILPIILYKLFRATKPVTRILLLLWIVMVIATALLTQSRGGILGLVVGAGFFLLVWLWQRQQSSSGLISRLLGLIRIRQGRWMLAVGLVAVLVILTWSLLSLREVSGAVEVRQQVMAGAFKTLRAHPVFGSGPGTLGEELVRRQKPLDTIWADAHNLPLTFAAETGTIGLIGLIWLAAVGIREIWTTISKVDRAAWNLAGLACAGALLGFAIHNLVDSLFKFPLIMLLVATWAGFWVTPQVAAGRQENGRYWSYPAMIGAIIVLGANTFIGVRGIENIQAYNQAVKAASQQSWQTSRDWLKVASELAPGLTFYQRQLGFVTGYLAEKTDDRTERSSLRQEASTHYRAALAGLDQLPVDHANLACLLWKENQPEAAIREMVIAHEMEPTNLLYRLNLGNYLEERGQVEAAREQYAVVLAAQPGYIQSGFWQQTEMRAAAMPDIIQQAADQLRDAESPYPAGLIELYLKAGDTEAARQSYERYFGDPDAGPFQSHLEKGRILLASGRLAEAQAEIEVALEAGPVSSEVYLVASKIALAQNRAGQAAEYAAAARFLGETPAVLSQSGLVAAANGDHTGAIEYFETAFAQLIAPPEPELSRYATEVARRRPLPAHHLPCLIRLYQTRILLDITQAEGDLLEQQGDYLQAGGVYRRLLRYEPEAAVITSKLDSLCRTHPTICDFWAK